jgi:CBS domain containing-hemolysin-like protein
MIEVLLILLALALVVVCGAFVAAEFSFVTMDRAAAEREHAHGVLHALRTLSTQLSGAQLGITVTNLLIGYLAEPSIARLIGGPEPLAVIVALVLATGATMIFGELVPKNLAIARPLATARAVQGFMRAFTRATRPVIALFNGSANALLRRIGVEPREELASARSAQELVSLVGRSAEQGTLEHGTAALLQRSLAFGDRRAHEIMTPRGRMVTVAHDAPASAVIAAARASGRSRFPVTDGQAFAGVVHLKQAVAHRESRVREIMAPPLLVPASLELDDLLDTLRAGNLQMALVVDEFGNVDGLVTLEDLVEEIVGEVRDEHDAGEAGARRERDGSWTLPGLMRPDEIRRTVGVELPEDADYETLGGLIGDRLARIPRAGDRIEVDGVTLTVLAMDDLRVERVRLVRR